MIQLRQDHKKITLWGPQRTPLGILRVKSNVCAGIAQSDSLRVGRPGDRIAVGARFSSSVQPRVKWVPGLSRGETNRGVRGVNHPPHLAPRSKKEYSYTYIPPVSLCGLFQDELYL